MEERLSEEKLARRLSEAAKIVKVGVEYKHYKNKSYQVLGLAILEATNEICVVYQAQYGKKLTFIRPLVNWLEKVQWKGEKLQRFSKI